ncbi:MAG: hypothetical protein K5911_06290 [Eubacteriales bacterium]|nr:hypothetical protein [Eubacteriales bacterium]
MATTYYKKNITKYLDTLPPEAPVTTDMVTAYMANLTGEPEDKVRKTINVNLARLERERVVSRITRGVYCKRINTPFGDYVPSKEMIYGRWLVMDGDSVIGYETGLSLMNHIGLVSQMPRRKRIATNNYSLPIPKDVDIEIQKPRATVTDDNYKYLQILDIIDIMEETPIDAAAPEEIIRDRTESAGLVPDRLIFYARKLYPTKTLERTVDVILGGLEL